MGRGLSGERPLLPSPDPTPHPQRLSTLSNPSSQLSPSFEGKRGMKGYKREEERRAPFPSKYLRRGSSGTRLRKRQLYIERAVALFSPQHFFIPARNQLLPLSHTQRDSCRAASPPVKSLSLFHLIPLTISPPKQNPLGHCCLWGLRRRTGAPPAHRYILHLKTEIPF